MAYEVLHMSRTAFYCCKACMLLSSWLHTRLSDRVQAGAKAKVSNDLKVLENHLADATFLVGQQLNDLPAC